MLSCLESYRSRLPDRFRSLEQLDSECAALDDAVLRSTGAERRALEERFRDAQQRRDAAEEAIIAAVAALPGPRAIAGKIGLARDLLEQGLHDHADELLNAAITDLRASGAARDSAQPG